MWGSGTTGATRSKAPLRRLFKLSKLLHADPELPKNPIEERGADLTSAVVWNGGPATVRMNPPLVTSSLTL
jgi:hypothetical protein